MKDGAEVDVPALHLGSHYGAVENGKKYVRRQGEGEEVGGGGEGGGQNEMPRCVAEGLVEE